MTPRLVLITDPSLAAHAMLVAVRAAMGALGPHAIAVQWRDKRPSPDVALAWALRDATRGAALFVVNGDLTLARTLEADGLHLGGNAPDVAGARAVLGPDAWISVAAHTDDDVRCASASGASGVLVSPIFPTPQKGPPRGLSAIRAARAIAPDMSVYALGGVAPTNVVPCREAGATGVAVIRALFGAPNPAAAARTLVL